MMKAQTTAAPISTTTAPTTPTTTATIAIAQTEIAYDPALSASAGCLAITDGTPALVAPNGDTLLHLAFFLVYTAEGRQLLRDHRPWGDAKQVEQIRAQLKAALRAKFATLANDRLDAVIDAHVAADGYVAAVQAQDTAAMTRQVALAAMLGTPTSLRLAIIGPAA